MGKNAKKTVIKSARFPLMAAGERLEGRNQAGGTLERRFHLATPGVYYLWLRVTSHGRSGSLLSFEVDDPSTHSVRGAPRVPAAKGRTGPGGAQVIFGRGRWKLARTRSHILVQPYAKSQWVCYTLQPEHKAQIHVSKPGVYTLRVAALRGNVTVEKVALTMFFSTKPKGDTLDHSEDPGGGRTFFPQSPLQPDGFRERWDSPGVAAMRRYFVDSEKGDDRKKGTSPGQAWKTFRNVNGRVFKPGDAVLLKRGCKWDAGLAPRGSGTEERPITVGAYGNGPRPVVNGVDEDALSLADQSWVVAQDLELTSDPAYHKCGLSAMAGEGKPRPRGTRVFNVVSHDNGSMGIFIGSRHGEKSNGFDGVIVENCLCFMNGNDGITVGGNDQNGCRNAVIRRCTAFGNRGMAGIWILSGENGLIEGCRAYDNICVNIWTWNSRNVTIRDCEAFRGHESDAAGFDIDWGCEAVTVEYCYSHHNEGDGFLLMGSGTANYRGFPMASRFNIMRYCVAEDDGAPICMTETFQDGKVYNNVAVAGQKGVCAIKVNGWPFSPGKDSGGWASDTEFHNNIFIGRNGGVPCWVDDFATGQGNSWDHNLYWNADGGAIIRWGGRESGPNFWKGNRKKGTFPPVDYRALAKFRRATGQETHGVQADPRLAGAGRGEYGRLPLNGYRLGRGSPAAMAGHRVRIDRGWLEARSKFTAETGASSLGIPMKPEEASQDWWGNEVDSSHGISIGIQGK